MNSYYKERLPCTGYGLCWNESLKIAELFKELRDWAKVRQSALDSNILQKNTQSTSQRLLGELSNRLRTLSNERFEFFLTSTDRKEQELILWLSVCRLYPVVGAFLNDGWRNNIQKGRGELTSNDFDHFFDSYTASRPNFNTLPPKRQPFVKKVVFGWFREIGILDKKQTIKYIAIGRPFIQFIKKDEAEDLSNLPATIDVIRGALN